MDGDAYKVATAQETKEKGRVKRRSAEKMMMIESFYEVSPSPLGPRLITELFLLLSPPFEKPSAPDIGGGGVELEGLTSIAPTPTPDDHVALLRGGGSSGGVPLMFGDAESAMPALKGLPALLSSDPAPDPLDPDAPLDVGRELAALDVPALTPFPPGRFRPMTGALGIRIPPLMAVVPVSRD